MSHKFDTPEAERLYGETPDEELGSVQDFGWYGLYLAEMTILWEDSQGFVTSYAYFSTNNLLADWEELEGDAARFYGDEDAEPSDRPTLAERVIAARSQFGI